MTKRLKQADDENQTRCWTSSGGHIWMNNYFDTLPASVRARLRASPFNLCPACMCVYFLPEVSSRFPLEKRYFVAIEAMEKEVRQGKK
jgi:hypothetical protein